MTDLEAARLQVEQFDRRNVERELDRKEPYSDTSIITFARALIAVTAERDKLRAACETLLACDRETDPGTELALLHEAVEKAREALKQH